MIIKMSETKSETLNRLYKENGLTKEDIFTTSYKGNKVTIITRTGIEKIQAKRGIKVSYNLIHVNGKSAVIQAYGEILVRDDMKPHGNKLLKMETFGEANADNLKGMADRYPVAMAEKRALSRVVLKLTGLYKEGIHGEDELTLDYDFDREKLDNMLFNSTLQGKAFNKMRDSIEMIDDQLSFSIVKQELEKWQLPDDPIDQGNSASAKDIQKKLDTHV